MIFSPSQGKLTRECFYLGVVLLMCTLRGIQPTYAADGLISNDVAAQYGLERAWFAQVRVDPARHRVSSWTLDNNQLFAITTDGTVQAMNAETGETLWVTGISSSPGATVGLAVSADYVAVLSAARLHLLQRSDGRLRWSREIGGAPSAAPAIGNRYAFVALLNGRIEGYELKNPTASVWQYQSNGRIFHSPATTGNVVSWPTDEGYLYVSSVENPQPLFRIHTNDEIVTAPAELAPFLYVASLDGYLYCFHEFTGNEIWRYATGFAITSKPAIVGDMAFVASEETAIHAVNGKNGDRLWRLDGVANFVALGTNYIYGMKPYGTLVAIDKASGTIVGQIPTTSDHQAIVNDQTDRIYLYDPRGSVQCLREIGTTEPTWHRQPADAAEKAPADQEDTSNPFGEDEAAATEEEDPADNPFGTEEPVDVFDDDNPF